MGRRVLFNIQCIDCKEQFMGSSRRVRCGPCMKSFARLKNRAKVQERRELLVKQRALDYQVRHKMEPHIDEDKS